MAQGINETAKKIKLDADGKPIVKKKIKLDADGKPIRKVKLDADGKPVKKVKPVEATKPVEDIKPIEDVKPVKDVKPVEKAKKAPAKKVGPNKALIAGITAACLVVASIGGVFAYNKISENKAPEVVMETEPPTTEAPETEAVTEPVSVGPEKQVVVVPTFVDCKVTGESIEKDLTMYIKNPDGKKLTGNKFQVLLVTSKNKSLVDEKVKAIKDINAKLEKALKEAEQKEQASNSSGPVVASATPSSSEANAEETSTDKYVSNDQIQYISSITGEELTEVEKLLIEKQEAYDEYAKALESIKGTIYTDEDGDGVIAIDKIDPGEYYAAFVPSESYIPATYTSKLKVKDKVEYKAVEEIKDKTVSEKQAGDTQEKNVTVEQELKDTVTYYPLLKQDKDTVVATKSTIKAFAAATAASTSATVRTTKTQQSTTEAATQPASSSAASTETPTTAATTEATSEATTAATTEATTDASTNASTEVPQTTSLSPTIKTVRALAPEDGRAVDATVTLSVSAKKIYPTADGTGSKTTITINKPESLKDFVIKVDSKEYTTESLTISANDLTDGDHTISATIKDADGNTVTIPSITINVEKRKTQLTNDKGELLYTKEDPNYPACVQDYKADMTVYTLVITPGAKHGWETDYSCYYDENGKKVTGDQVINGVQYSFSNDGILLKAGLGIDVSKWQGKIDWKKASNAVGFAIIRCGIRGKTGELAIDSYCGTNLQNAKANGVKVGLYFYSRAQNEVQAVEEASLAVSIANQYGGLNLPIYIDMEDATQAGLSNAQRDAIVNAFCTTVKNSGYSAGVYANKNWMTNKLSAKSYSGISIWVAQYAEKCTYSGSYKMWQYTSKGSIPGISGNVDMNMMY